jgi:ethanolamine kinase
MTEKKIYGAFEIIFINQTIHFDSHERDIERALSVVDASIDLRTIRFQIFTGGITNQVIWVKIPGRNGYVFRLYGDDTDKFIDREREIINNQTASNAGVSPGVVFIFANGVCLEYAPGSPMTREGFADFNKAAEIARTMAKMHVRAICPSGDNLPILQTTFFNTWLQVIPDELDSESKSQKLREIKAEFGDFGKACSDLLARLKDVGSPVVFCHNDLLCGNVLYENGCVRFIDMEYGGANYRGFDIGDHFCEFAGIESPDFSLYPDKEFQYKWLRVYLEEVARLKGEDTGNVQEADVEKLYIEVNKFAPACHLMWGLWALMQARYSNLDYDYLEYSHMRLTEYRKGLAFFDKHPN